MQVLGRKSKMAVKRYYAKLNDRAAMLNATDCGATMSRLHLPRKAFLSDHVQPRYMLNKADVQLLLLPGLFEEHIR